MGTWDLVLCCPLIISLAVKRSFLSKMGTFFFNFEADFLFLDFCGITTFPFWFEFAISLVWLLPAKVLRVNPSLNRRWLLISFWMLLVMNVLSDLLSVKFWGSFALFNSFFAFLSVIWADSLVSFRSTIKKTLLFIRSPFWRVRLPGLLCFRKYFKKSRCCNVEFTIDSCELVILRLLSPNIFLLSIIFDLLLLLWPPLKSFSSRFSLSFSTFRFE